MLKLVYTMTMWRFNTIPTHTEKPFRFNEKAFMDGHHIANATVTVTRGVTEGIFTLMYLKILTMIRKRGHHSEMRNNSKHKEEFFKGIF